MWLDKKLTEVATESAASATPYTRVDIGNGDTNVYTDHTVIDRFKRGALWQRNHVWHDVADELPEERRNVLATTASPKGRGIMEGGVTMVVDRGLLEADKKGTFKKWAYLSDLFPTDMEL